MLLLRLMVTLGVCWLVKCDLLDLYVQHMDETMRTMLYRNKRHPMDPASRAKRSPVEDKPVLRVGHFKKQRLNFDKDWLAYWKANKDVYYKNDALDYPNRQEGNWNPNQHEILSADFEKTLGGAAEANVSAPTEVAKPTFGIAESKVESIPRESTAIEEEREELEYESSDEVDELAIEDADSKERLPMEDSKNREAEVENEGNSRLKVTDTHRKIYQRTFDVSSGHQRFKRPPKSLGRKKFSPKLEGSFPSVGKPIKGKQETQSPMEDNTVSRNDSPVEANFSDLDWRVENEREAESRVKDETVIESSRTKRSVQKPRFVRYEVLDDDGDVVLEWDPFNEENVTFRVTARTLGYVGIGFNEKSYMKGADILLAWVDDHTGAVNLLDSHGTEEPKAAPVTDTSQDVRVLGGSQNGTHTTVTFMRKWHTCDPQDHQLTGDTIRVLWAFHPNDPELNAAVWHGKRRGGRALRLKTAAAQPAPPRAQGGLHWDVKFSQFTVSPKMDTIYWCKIFQSPLDQKHHMIGYTPLVEKANEDLVHHIILYECASTLPILSAQTKLAGAPCYSTTNPMPAEWETCMQPVLAWARGSKGEWMPEHVGIPVAMHGNNTYYMLEVHYNNPHMRNVNDSSGVRLHLTSEHRPQEAGILVAGVAVSPLHLVPPRQEAFASVGYCTTDCTDTMFPKDGINVVSVVLHSHLAGRRLSLKHIRQGKELPRIVQDNHFDFDYQQSHTLEKEVKVLPGDELVAECVYGTLDRETPTLGGYAASQEMCLAFIVHYPKTPLAACYSMTPVRQLFEVLGVKKFKGMSMEKVEKLFLTMGMDSSLINEEIPENSTTGIIEKDNATVVREAMSAIKAMMDYTEERESDNVFTRLIIETPEEFKDRTVTEHMLALAWTDETLANMIQTSLYRGNYMTFCRKRDDKLALPPYIQAFPNFTALPEANDTTCKVSGGAGTLHTFVIYLVTIVNILSVFVF